MRIKTWGIFGKTVGEIVYLEECDIVEEDKETKTNNTQEEVVNERRTN